MWGPVRQHKMKGAPMPPRPALALAEPEASLTLSDQAATVYGEDCPGDEV